MDIVTGRLEVFFEAPFWIGIFERVSDGSLSVCKVTFGAEHAGKCGEWVLDKIIMKSQN